MSAVTCLEIILQHFTPEGNWLLLCNYLAKRSEGFVKMLGIDFIFFLFFVLSWQKKRSQLAFRLESCGEKKCRHVKSSKWLIIMETEIYNAAAVNGNSQRTANCLMDSAGLFAFISYPNASPLI